MDHASPTQPSDVPLAVSDAILPRLPPRSSTCCAEQRLSSNNQLSLTTKVGWRPVELANSDGTEGFKNDNKNLIDKELWEAEEDQI